MNPLHIVYLIKSLVVGWIVYQRTKDDGDKPQAAPQPKPQPKPQPRSRPAKAEDLPDHIKHMLRRC